MHRYRPTRSDVVFFASLLLIAGSVGWARQYGPPPPSRGGRGTPPAERVELASAHFLGRESASVVVLAFSDFQCQYCARFAAQTLPALKERFIDRGLVRLGLMHAPAPLRPYSLLAAEMSVCAESQGRFWPLFDLLFRRQADLNGDVLRDLASRAGMPVTGPGGLDECLAAGARARVAEHAAAAYTLGVRSTPLFLIGRSEGGSLRVEARIKGAKPIEEFERVFSMLSSPLEEARRR
jgi:protein-disulfide isomerase